MLMSSVDKNNINSSFPIFVCFIKLAKTFSMLLNQSGGKEHHCLGPDLKKKVFSFSLERLIVCVNLNELQGAYIFGQTLY